MIFSYAETTRNDRHLKIFGRNKCIPIIMALSSFHSKKPLGLYARIPISTAGFFNFIHFSTYRLAYAEICTVQYSTVGSFLKTIFLIGRVVTIDARQQ
jgi:hypothetical protein